MNQRQRKQFGSVGNLTIKGTGFVGSDNSATCRKLQNALLPTGIVPRGAVAVPCRTASSTTTTTLRKTGSIGNIRSLTSSSISSTKAIPKGISTCACRVSGFDHSAVHFQEQYTRQLQQQIYLLELENNYLKHGTRKASRNNDEDDSYRSAISPSPSPSQNPNVTPEQKPSKNCILEDDRERPTRTRKKVSYAEPEVTEKPNLSNRRELNPLSQTAGQTELLHKLEESYQRERKLEERLKQKMTEVERIAYENTQLSEHIGHLEAKSQKNEENFARDKRALVEEAVELQRRLDYLTPALADKESHLAKLEIEKDELNDKLRNATGQLNEMQIKMDERRREEREPFDVEGKRNIDVGRLLRTIRRLENIVEELKNKEASLIDDIARMKRSLREEQLTAKKDKTVAEKALEENSALIKENSHLSAQLSRLEMRMKTLSQQVDSARERPAEIVELDQYQKAEESARESRARMQKELDALKTLSESLSNENKSLRHEKFTLSERCEELLRKLSEKSKDASSLREEVRNLEKQNLELLRKMEGQENELHSCRERYESAERKYKDALEDLEKQKIMRREKSEEYEKLAKQVLELSDSVKDRKPLSPSFVTRPSKPPTSQTDKTYSSQPLSRRASSATIPKTSEHY